MTKCSLTMLVEGPGQRTIAPGESVRVTVQVEAHGAVACDGLRLELGWRTHGRGDREVGVAWTRSLYSGDWAAGSQAEFEYEAPIPPIGPGNPATHHGEHFNVDWYLTASVHEGSAVIATQEKSLYVAPPQEGYSPPQVVTVEPIPWNAGRRLSWLPGVALLLAGAAVGMRVPLAGLPIFLGGAALSIRALRRAQATYRCRDLEFGHWPGQVVPGSEVHVFLAGPAELVAELRESTWTLAAIEKATSRNGTEVTHYTRTAYSESLPIGDGLGVEATVEPRPSRSGAGRLETVFRVPAEAPGPMELKNHSLQWELTLGIRGLSHRLSFRHPLGS